MSARDALTQIPSTPVVIRREDYRPPTHRISNVKLQFTLDLERTQVINEFECESTGTEKELHLYGDELSLVSVSVNGRPLESDEFEASSQHLVILSAPRRAVICIETQLNPTANTALMGLYASRGGLFTQCESEGFRRITYFLDRPDVMAIYDVTLRGKKQHFPVLLSNGNLVDQRDLADGWHEARWQDPFPKPSYLFALVAADLDHIEEVITTASGRRALLQVYTRKEDLAQANFALRALRRAIFWDEYRYGLELDLERFMIVAVPDFNSGAMENKGLNLFNTKFVLADPQTATDIDYDGIESVVAHEYFHNWTGNRVTCRDWFQLTLKEGLTVFRDSEFSADMAAEGLTPQAASSARAVRRIDAVRTLRAAQFPEDSGPMSHSIRPDSYQEIRNFYTATVYEKGAEVIRMLQTMLGVSGFRKGMDLYFSRHDGQAVTCEEFVHAIFDANQSTLASRGVDGMGFAERFMRWYDTSGTPVLAVRDSWNSESGVYELRFRQKIDARSPSQAPLMIPIVLGLIDRGGGEFSYAEAEISSGVQRMNNALLLQEAEAHIRLVLPERPVPSLLRDFSAPVFLDYPYSQDQLLHLLAFDSDPFNRWEAGQQLMLNRMLDADAVDIQAMIGAFRQIIDDQALDDGYKAALLTLPSELYISERVGVIDPDAIRAARDELRIQLARGMRDSLIQLDTEFEAAASEEYSPDPVSAGRRSLANLVQQWLAVTGQLSSQQMLDRYESSTNMTDRLAALQVLIELDTAEAATALELYMDTFRDHSLAIDKWFSAQVTIPSAQALDRVRQLMTHPLFDVSNPNRVRSVLGAFFNQNLPGFHRLDGRGYILWAEAVVTIDRRNSQLASRLARALDRWARFENNRKASMYAALERVFADEYLSPDVREVVGKALT